MSGADQPAASTKRAKLIAMLERPEGASVAEIGQRLGWLPAYCAGRYYRAAPGRPRGEAR